ncbi:MAG: PKD domain-containing protein [Candidatus Thermoplasmatota archaeon]|nr:PKD domain-containing protein [Candidatus Thermoplasmatota archaeon]
MTKKKGLWKGPVQFLAILSMLALLPSICIEGAEGEGTRIGRHDLTIWSVQVDPMVIGPGVLQYPDTYDADRYKNQQTTMDVSVEVPNEGDTVLINLTVFNLGLEEGSAEVEFYDGPRESGTFIGRDTVDVKALNYDIARSSWDTNGIIGEEHEIFAYIIPHDPDNETNSENNQGSREILVNFYPSASIRGYYVEDIFGADIEEGDSVLFDGTPSSDTQRDLDAGLTFTWDFNDPFSNTTNPDTSSGLNLTMAEHRFGDAGSFTATLKVTDQHGASRNSSFTINVSQRPPIAVILPEVSLFSEDEAICFDASSTRDSSHDLELMEYMWDTGDGMVTEWSRQPLLVHSYPFSGIYSVQLWARDDEGCMGNTMKEIEIVNVKPLSWIERAWVDGDEISVIDGIIEVAEDEIIDLEGGASDSISDLDGLTFLWRSGDGDMIQGRNISISYTTNGERTVTLIVTDDDADTSSTVIDIIVSNLPPVADAGEGGTFTTSNIKFDASGSRDTPSDLSLLRYSWDFGDGEEGEGKVVYHTYKDRGTYDVTLTVTDDDGEKTIDRIRVTVENLAPEPFIEGFDEVVEDEVFILDAGSSTDPDGEIRSFLWSFQDGGKREGSMIMHSFHSSGEYTIMLEVTDNDGATSKLFWTVTVENVGPLADAGPDNETVVGKGIILDASGSNDTPSDLMNLSFEWSLPNGSLIYGRVIELVFDVAGSHKVILKVMDPEGLISMDEILLRVLESALESISVTVGVEPERCEPGDHIMISGQVIYVFSRPMVEHETGIVMVSIFLGKDMFRVFPDRNGNFELTLSAPLEVGQHEIRCSIKRLGLLEEQTITLIVQNEKDVNAVVAFARSPAGMISGSAVLLIGGGFAFAMSTDIGRWRFFLLFIPLFSRIKRDEVLDNFERGRIYQYIIMNPGDYFSHIKGMLGLNNGTLTYHLKVLEQREFIRSVTEGSLKRFYPFGMRVDAGGHRDIQSMILEFLALNPGMSQKEIARSLGVHVSTINYHINMMVGAGLLRSDRRYRTQRYEVQYMAVEVPVDL